MKYTIAAVILAVTTSVSGRATPIAARGTANPYKNYLRIPEVKNPDQHDVSQVCIDFKSTREWYYQNAGGLWGSGAGKSPSKVCVPTSNASGGGMFIGPNPHPDANSTKIECFFPASGSTPANCDISIVNGYSLSATCKTSSIKIGGNFDGFTDGGPKCAHRDGPNCVNLQGPYATNVSQVGPFFQPANKNGQKYCIWDLCPQEEGIDPSFPVHQQLTCTISGGL